MSVFFLSENVQFLEVKFYIYLNRRVFVMIVQKKAHTAVKLDIKLVSSVTQSGV